MATTEKDDLNKFKKLRIKQLKGLYSDELTTKR